MGDAQKVRASRDGDRFHYYRARRTRGWYQLPSDGGQTSKLTGIKTTIHALPFGDRGDKALWIWSPQPP
jgi:hypothetical protein